MSDTTAFLNLYLGGPLASAPVQGGRDWATDVNFELIDAAMQALHAQDIAFQLLPNDGAIAIVAGTVIITKTSQAHITAPLLPTPGSALAGGDDGSVLRIISSTPYAHYVTFPANSVQTINGLKTTLTMVPGGAALSCHLIAYNGLWVLDTLTGGGFS